MHWPKCCEYYNEDEENSPNTLNVKYEVFACLK